jgi:hypothetical protein
MVFSDEWRALMNSFVSGGSVATKINDDVDRYFQTLKCLRHSDPLSQLLFNIVVDMLAIMIKCAKVDGLIEGVVPHLVDGGLSILQYVDDTILFMEHDFVKARKLKLISGLKINFHKSELYCFGEAQDEVNVYADLFGFGHCIVLFVIKVVLYIAKVMESSSPCVTFRRNLSGQRLLSWNALLQLLANVHLQDGSDVFRWNLHENAKFIVESLYSALIQPDIPIDKTDNDKRWKLKFTLRVKVLGWYLRKGVILTKDNLASRNRHGSKQCVFFITTSQ